MIQHPTLIVALIPKTIYSEFSTVDFPYDVFKDPVLLSRILSEEDICYYIWYNSRLAAFLPEMAGEVKTIATSDPFQQWVSERGELYETCAKAHDVKYSIAEKTKKKSVDYDCVGKYTPAYQAGVLFMLGHDKSPYESLDLYYDAILTEMSKTMSVKEMAEYCVFDNYLVQSVAGC